MTKKFNLCILSVFIIFILAISVAPKVLFKPMMVSAETYENLSYRITDGEVTITDCDSDAIEFEIPAEISGYPVTEIGIGAFCECTSLTSIKIPNSVTSIGDSSFYHCTNLTTVSIPNSVVLIDLTAFVKCKNLRAVTISNSNTGFAEIEDTEFVVFVGDRPFDDCPNLTIYGEKGSNIEKYAEENDIPFSPLDSIATKFVKGKTYKFKAFSNSSNVTWSTSDSKVASVSKDGKVKAVSAGTCYIYAFDGKTVKSFKIKVT